MRGPLLLLYIYIYILFDEVLVGDALAMPEPIVFRRPGAVEGSICLVHQSSRLVSKLN